MGGYEFFTFSNIEHKLLRFNELEDCPEELIIEAKKAGFSDFQLARSILKSKDIDFEKNIASVRKFRIEKNIIPFVKQIDTLAAEYPTTTNYLKVSNRDWFLRTKTKACGLQTCCLN